MIRYETPQYYFVRKPHGIPTTFGVQFSFLEQIVKEKPGFFAALQQYFSEEQEYGLVNRLDNDTAGLLYFCKTPEVVEKYKSEQATKGLWKIYMCDVAGEMSLKYPINGARVEQVETGEGVLGEKMAGIKVSYPIMHHVNDAERMVAIKTEKDWNKGRGRENHVDTIFVPLEYNQETHRTLCYAVIQQGMRHQIRVHAASIGYPVVGDPLYAKNNDNDYLHLWSIGLIGDLHL